MDASQACSPHIKKVLKSYQTAAMTSLSGPNGFMASWNCSPSTKMSSEDSASDGSGSGSNIKKKVSQMTATATTTNSGMSIRPNGGKREIADYDPLLAPPPFPIQQMPILVAADQSRSERSETVLEGESISCFVVGGEKRLCLPQILNTVLRDFSLHQINVVCDELQIFCSRCNPEQLDVLKVTGILPFSAPSCGLITKTDAERLCSALQLCNNPGNYHMFKDPLDGADGPLDDDDDGGNSGDDGGVGVSGDVDLDVDEKNCRKRKKRFFRFHIYHECFGKCKGIYTPDLYTGPLARCIECTECRAHFSPQKFVCHAHKALENRTCHWGFDSANWKAYILLAKDQKQDGPEKTLLQKHLDEMKARHHDVIGPKMKRKIEEDEKDAMKKPKFEDPSAYFPYVYDPMPPTVWYPGAGVTNGWPRASAFRPWSPMVGKDGKLVMPPPFPHAFPAESLPPQPLPSYLSHGPPVLLNPERVVPVSETERFERHYQPNVALAPPSAQIQAQQKAAQNAAPHSRGKVAASTMNTSIGNSHATACHTASPSSQVAHGTSSSTTTVTSVTTGHNNQRSQIQPELKYPSEIELSTDTDETFSDSTFDAESPARVLSPQVEEERDSKAFLMDRDEECFVDLGKPLTRLSAVLKKEGLSGGVQEKILQEASLMWKNFERHVAIASQLKTEYQQELKRVRQSKKERLREASESKRELRKEVERLCGERDAWHQQASQLRLQVDRLNAVQQQCQHCSSQTVTPSKNQPVDAWHRVKAEPGAEGTSCADTACQVNLPGENEHLRSKIDAMGEELQNLQHEIGQLRRRAQCGGKSVNNGAVGPPVRFSSQMAGPSTSSTCAAPATGD